ncbi:MAG: NUMOD1 domain-containing DNA-binding protein [Candidatus Woesearchaeota archaeon]|jgi:hypothetical protein|nr:NUMOD1 domain-containing DNA-binding protein [Candidatus Woesearchaeota archaeon]
MNKIKYIVYLTVNIANKKIYIGVHKTSSEKFDGYIGCGVFITQPCTYKNSTTAFQYAVNKYGVDKFLRFTLYEFDTEEEAYKKEEELVTEDFVKRENTYNMMIGGKTWSNNQKIKVYMYNLEGEFIEKFDSVNDAGRFFNKQNGSEISKSIRLGHQCHGHQFSYKKLPFMKHFKRKVTKKTKESIEKTISKQRKSVGKFSKDGVLLETFKSLNACRRAGYTNAQGVIEKRRNHCKGFIFKYI